jgi:hypothetical protein
MNKNTEILTLLLPFHVSRGIVIAVMNFLLQLRNSSYSFLKFLMSSDDGGISSTLDRYLIENAS